ncbi:glycine cleavage system aminomethyltransferase GcvT [Inmirania thermothiophila]|uniref:Aminomethyltransferase n=1 Tax=Inmirania thermothiophila TaxID=1750597 RepID=A0A3N1Y793_9GAMM|nr:glycine cleavage system aminomethyltransferase GcvT [Inmirania thermothiophila]ROR34645.1 aminomethyltransferase [Inmirania thermothiophila]
MSRRTPLHDHHVAGGARMVEFAGWRMPLHYGSQVEEHHRVRREAGMFDVSHMTIVDLEGPAARPFLRRLLANDVDRLQVPGKALYGCMLNERGGVVDDLIAYFLAEGRFRLVVNAATREKDLDWIRRHAAPFEVAVTVRDDLAMLAVQGPAARERVHRVLGAGADAAARLAPFHGAEIGGLFVARTGYTGEDGYELMIPAAEAGAWWDRLREAGVAPCGLGARDTLRLEAGMCLYGQDMDEEVTPLECGLGWTVAWEPASRAFIGREALEAQRAAGVTVRAVGLLLEGRGVLRHGQKVYVPGQGEGVVTSGGFSPTLGRSIGLARVPVRVGTHCEVEIRGRRERARIVKPPFVRHGRVMVDLGGGPSGEEGEQSGE